MTIDLKVVRPAKVKPILPDIDRMVEIERLATLGTVDYEVARKAAAERFGMRPTVLDAALRKTRKRLRLDTVIIPDAVPWHEPVDSDYPRHHDRAREALRDATQVDGGAI